MATFEIQPPDLKECKSFEVYMTKLTVWETAIPAPKDKRLAVIAASLPNNSVKTKKTSKTNSLCKCMVLNC